MQLASQYSQTLPDHVDHEIVVYKYLKWKDTFPQSLFQCNGIQFGIHNLLMM